MAFDFVIGRPVLAPHRISIPQREPVQEKEELGGPSRAPQTPRHQLTEA